MERFTTDNLIAHGERFVQFRPTNPIEPHVSLETVVDWYMVQEVSIDWESNKQFDCKQIRNYLVKSMILVRCPLTKTIVPFWN